MATVKFLIDLWEDRLLNINKERFVFYTGLVSKYIIVLILLVSGITKITNPINTIEVLTAFDLLPETFNILISSLLPILEIGLAVFLVINFKEKLIKTIVVVLFLCFLMISISGYLIGFDKDCGCFGDLISSTFGVQMILRNLIFVIITVIVYKNKNVWPGKLSN